MPGVHDDKRVCGVLRGAREPQAELYRKRGRMYLDARAWEAWGGILEALVPTGEGRATRDRVTAAILFGERLAEPRTLRVATECQKAGTAA